MTVVITRRVKLAYRGYHVPYADGTWYMGLPEEEAKAKFETYYKAFGPVTLDVVRENAHAYFGVRVGGKLNKAEKMLSARGSYMMPKGQWVEI